MRAVARAVAIAAIFLLPLNGLAEQLVIQFRSVEDPDVPPDASLCAGAPFVTTLALGASLVIPRTRASDGQVTSPGQRSRGTGTACFGIPIEVILAGFPPFSQADVLAEFEIDGLRVLAAGICTATSNDLPVAGIVFAGCALQVLDAPEGFAGGSVTSNSVFNPFGIPGVDTGSFWTLRLVPE